MRDGHVWESICDSCSKKASYDERWQEEAPTDSPPHSGGCCESNLKSSHWERSHIHLYGPNMGGAIDPMPRPIPEHFNTSLGRTVHSREHLEHLQARLGVEDAIVKGDAAERLVPRDIGRRFKHHREVAEAVEKDSPITTRDEGRGAFDVGAG